MAHWFHRNPIKATDEVKFELKSVLTSPESSRICGQLRVRRKQLLEYFSNASNDLKSVDDDFNEYLALFAGFIVPIGPSGREYGAASKLAPLLRFRWANSMTGPTAV
ncbi:unnamed protein product [Toxocara canis]|uniref:BRO1 domain-containing protein n=1 Tax=Toxocara canis TaxID=6265 RepID=A0A183U6T2_TOXCA|nr:unnamed protein product [Toxocara canis]